VDVVEGERVEPNQQTARGRAMARRAALITIWSAATLLGLAVAATTRIGPVLFSVSGSHGVHLGDVVAFAMAYGAAIVVTPRLTRSPVPPRTPPAARMPSRAPR
jgi:hypothetical protein